MKKKNLLMTAIAILGLATTTSAQVPSYVPTSGLIGWWPFNGNANDESGNGNNGTVNGATLITDRFGNSSSAYDFNGTNSFIQVSSNNELELTDNYTINGWFSADVFFNTSNSDRSIISKIQSTGWYGGYEVMVGGNTNDIAHVGNVGGNNFVLGSIGYSIGVWYMFSVSYDGNTMKLFMNGILVNSNTVSGVLQTSNLPLLFGKRDNNFQYFDGKIDDIGIWNRALTQQEITDLYNGCLLTVSAQPTNQTININNNAQFVVSSSDPSATYQWQTDLGVGFQNLNSVGQYIGTTNDTLTVSNVTMSNNNQPFRCIISSGSCTDTSAVAVLTVVSCSASVTTQPINQSVNISNNAQFTTASSDPLATYQWQTDLGVGFQNLNSVGQYIGTTNDTLIVSNVTMSNNNQPFRCIISSGSCIDTSDVAILTVNNNVGINENTQDNLFSVFPNPAQSVINVKTDSKLIGDVYSIYDNTGRVVLTGKLNSQNTTIELGNLSGGIYMFSVGENMKQTFKLIKE